MESQMVLQSRQAIHSFHGHKSVLPIFRSTRSKLSFSKNRWFSENCSIFIDKKRFMVCNYKGNDQEENASEENISREAKIRSEVNAPFRTLRMFFYLAFIASASVGALISITRAIAALGGAPNADPIEETLKGLGIDVAAIVSFALLYRSDTQAEKKSVARFTREGTLSKLRLELSNSKVVTIGQLRGTCRILVVVGPKDHISQVLQAAIPLKSKLVERGVLLTPFYTDGTQNSIKDLLSSIAAKELDAISENADDIKLGKRFVAVPVYTNEWSRWLKEQMELAGVSGTKPVYISLRLDGRVRASGVGFPPLSIIADQLPPLKGIWAGPLDGMDGRVL